MKLIYGLFIYILSIIFLFIGVMLLFFLSNGLSLVTIILFGIAGLFFLIASIYIIIFWTFFLDAVYLKNKLIIEDLRNGSIK